MGQINVHSPVKLQNLALTKFSKKESKRAEPHAKNLLIFSCAHQTDERKLMKKLAWSFKQVVTSASMMALYLLLASVGVLVSAAANSFQPLGAITVIAFVVTLVWTVVFAFSECDQQEKANIS